MPTMNFVGIVGSYSRETPPRGREDSRMFGHSFSDSVGSPNLRISHQNTWPSVLVEKHSAPERNINHSVFMYATRLDTLKEPRA